MAGAGSNWSERLSLLSPTDEESAPMSEQAPSNPVSASSRIADLFPSSPMPVPGRVSYSVEIPDILDMESRVHERLHQRAPRYTSHTTVDLEAGHVVGQHVAPQMQQPELRARAANAVAEGPNDGNGDSGSNTAQDGENGESVAGYVRQIIGQNPELKGILQALEKYIPFILLIAAKQIFDHSTGIVVFVCLLTTFLHANSVVRQQVTRQDRRNALALLAVLVNLVACIAFIYFVFQDEKIYYCAVFMPPSRVDSLYDLLWLVGVNDFILKFVAVIFKVFLVFFPARLLPYQKKGKYFLFTERMSQLHRELAPIQIWLTYLLNGYERIPGKVLGVMLVAAYMVAKGKLLLRSAKALKLAVEKLLQSTSYGKSPSTDEVKATGGNCPICYDCFRLPTMLHCKHTFCEECIALWLDREKSCPLCRAKVTEDPEWRDGSTSQFVQLF